MSGIYRQVFSTFWSDPKVVDSFSPEDKYFYLYLITNEHTNQCGIYQISVKQMAFDLGYSIEAVRALIERFQSHLKRIRYNPETREMAVLNWAKHNYPEKTTDNRFYCIEDELEMVQDRTLVDLVLQHATATIQAALLNQVPSKPLSTPYKAPSKPLGEEEEQEQEKEEEETRATAEHAETQEPNPSGALTNYPVILSEVPHFQIAGYWFRKYNQVTGLTIMPDDRANLAAKDLFRVLGSDIKLAERAVDYYFDNWRDLWFACKRMPKETPPEKRQWSFAFSSFVKNIQEILSLMQTSPTQANTSAAPQRWSSGISFEDTAISEEERAENAKKLSGFIQNLEVSKRGPELMRRG